MQRGSHDVGIGQRENLGRAIATPNILLRVLSEFLVVLQRGMQQRDRFVSIFIGGRWVFKLEHFVTERVITNPRQLIALVSRAGFDYAIELPIEPRFET